MGGILMITLSQWKMKLLKEKKNICAIILLAFFVTSCGYSPSDPGPSYPTYGDAQGFVDNLSNDVGAIDDYVLKKYETEQAGGYIILMDDFGDLRGIDIYLGSRYSQYSSDMEFFDAHSFPVDDIGNNYFEDYSGNIYEETAVTKKDLEHMGAIIEKVNRGKFQKYVVNKFQLSEQRAESLSKLYLSWKKIEKKRGITKEDIKVFSSKLLGFDFVDGVSAYRTYLEGDGSDLNLLLEKAAEVNQTDPEHMKMLFQLFLK